MNSLLYWILFIELIEWMNLFDNFAQVFKAIWVRVVRPVWTA